MENNPNFNKKGIETALSDVKNFLDKSEKGNIDITKKEFNNLIPNEKIIIHYLYNDKDNNLECHIFITNCSRLLYHHTNYIQYVKYNFWMDEKIMDKFNEFLIKNKSIKFYPICNFIVINKFYSFKNVDPCESMNGSENSENYSFEADDKKYAIRIEKNNKLIDRYEEICSHCESINNKNGKFLKYIKNKNGKYVSSLDDKIYIVSEYIDGKSYRPLSTTQKKSLIKNLKIFYFEFENNPKFYLFNKHSEEKYKGNWTDEEFKKMKDQLKKYIPDEDLNFIEKERSKIIPINSQDQLIHQDIFCGNILFNNNDDAFIIDPYSMCIGSKLADLGYCAYQFSCGNNKEFEEFIKLYIENNLMNKEEVNILFSYVREMYLRRTYFCLRSIIYELNDKDIESFNYHKKTIEKLYEFEKK